MLPGGQRNPGEVAAYHLAGVAGAEAGSGVLGRCDSKAILF